MITLKDQGGEDVPKAPTARLALAVASIERVLVYGSSLTARTMSPAIIAGRAPLSAVLRLLSAVRRLTARLLDRGGATADALGRERRRLAADVHDLIMQDLALALGTARKLSDDPAAGREAQIIVAAGERALANARELANGLIAEDRKPVVDAVEASVRTAAGRTELRFDAARVPTSVQPDEPTVDTLVHVGREAVTNAIKHAEPSAIEVELEYVDEWRLRVSDDGRGFDATAADGGFGLVSMSRHADALGGSLRLASDCGAGTTVEVILP